MLHLSFSRHVRFPLHIPYQTRHGWETGAGGYSAGKGIHIFRQLLRKSDLSEKIIQFTISLATLIFPFHSTLIV